MPVSLSTEVMGFEVVPFFDTPVGKHVLSVKDFPCGLVACIWRQDLPHGNKCNDDGDVCLPILDYGSAESWILGSLPSLWNMMYGVVAVCLPEASTCLEQQLQHDWKTMQPTWRAVQVIATGQWEGGIPTSVGLTQCGNNPPPDRPQGSGSNQAPPSWVGSSPESSSSGQAAGEGSRGPQPGWVDDDTDSTHLSDWERLPPVERISVFLPQYGQSWCNIPAGPHGLDADGVIHRVWWMYIRTQPKPQMDLFWWVWVPPLYAGEALAGTDHVPPGTWVTLTVRGRPLQGWGLLWRWQARDPWLRFAVSRHVHCESLAEAGFSGAQRASSGPGAAHALLGMCLIAQVRGVESQVLIATMGTYVLVSAAVVHVSQSIYELMGTIVLVGDQTGRVAIQVVGNVSQLVYAVTEEVLVSVIDRTGWAAARLLEDLFWETGTTVHEVRAIGVVALKVVLTLAVAYFMLKYLPMVLPAIRRPTRGDRARSGLTPSLSACIAGDGPNFGCSGGTGSSRRSWIEKNCDSYLVSCLPGPPVEPECPQVLLLQDTQVVLRKPAAPVSLHCLSVFLSVCLSVRLSVCLSLCLSVCLSVCLSACCICFDAPWGRSIVSACWVM